MENEVTYIMDSSEFPSWHRDEPGPRGEQGYSIPIKPKSSGSGEGFTQTFELVFEKPKRSADYSKKCPGTVFSDNAIEYIEAKIYEYGEKVRLKE